MNPSKNSLLEKIAVYIINKRHTYLVNVCAWCPKETYPKLHNWQKYTHGICKKHYMELSNRYNDKQGFQSKLDKFISSLLPKLPLVQKY